MARITIYKNSILATLLSFLSYFAVVMGIMLAFDSEILGGIAIVAVGIGIMALAAWVNSRATFRKWIKKLTKDGVIERAKSDTNLAVQIYKANPSKQTLDYIWKINVMAADYIERNLAPKK